MSAGNSAYNKAQIKKARANLGAVIAAGNRGVVDVALPQIGMELTGEIQVELSKPGTGRVYRRRTVVHQASAPGEPPAPDTGRYRASWGWQVMRRARTVVVSTAMQLGCVFDPNTRVQTLNGPKRIADVAVGDRVLTQTGEYREVVATRSFAAIEKPDLVTVRVHHRRTPLVLTRDHPVLAARDGRNVWVPAGELAPGDLVYRMVRNQARRIPWVCENCGGQRNGKPQANQRFCSVPCRAEHWTTTRSGPHWGAVRSPAARAKMSVKAKERLRRDPESHPSRRVARRGFRTSCEKAVEAWLTERGTIYDRQVPVGCHVVDFYLPGEHRIIEADGAYWHRDQQRDIDRDRDLRDEWPDVRITHLHFYDQRFTPVIDPAPLAGVDYVVCNPGPKSYVEPGIFALDSVVSIEPWVYGSEPVRPRGSRPARLYDLSVEGVHSFVANGVVVSNSWLEFGTSKMEPRPHVRPAVARYLPRIRGRIADAWVAGQRTALRGGTRKP